MKIAFVTTQSPEQSTIVGRILPLATRLRSEFKHQIHLLGHEGNSSSLPPSLTWHTIGQNPFTVEHNQKVRQQGLSLVARLLKNTIATFRTLSVLQPEAIIIVKPLPQNVAAVSLYCRWLSLIKQSLPRLILDMDDYELTANHLTSIAQRGAIHWAEQEAHRLALVVTVATPFLEEYSRQLAPNLSRHLIPTSADLPSELSTSCDLTSPVVLYIGSLSITSGHRIDLLPEIWKQIIKELPQVRLRIAGDGHDINQLKQQFASATLHDSVTFTGRFSTNDLPTLLKDAYLIIDPIDASLTNRAKSSFRASLAAFLGLPYVSSNIGIRPLWFPESHHEQFFAKPGDAAHYAQKAIQLLKQPLPSDQLQQLQQHSQRFSWELLTTSFNKALTL